MSIGKGNMKRRLIEESVLFISILKWVIVATGIGTIVGFSTALFLMLLDWSMDAAGRYSHYFLLLPLGLALSAWVINRLEPDAKGYGIEKVIAAVHHRGGRINASIVPIKLLATIVTIATGGSAGQVGPCGQIGASLASFTADLFKLDVNDRKKLVVCGLSAGFAAVLGAPFAGAIFGVEVLYVGSLLYEVLLPSFIAGITGYQIASLMGIHYQFFPLHFTPTLSEAFILKIVLAGLFFGLCSVMLIDVMKAGEKIVERIRLSPWLRGLIGGTILIGLTLLFSRPFLGSGMETIQAALGGQKILFYAFFLKAVFTSITLNFGGSGGMVMPILFVGATAGSLFGELLGLDRATFAAVGFVSLLAGTANTPIAASIMAVEFFGGAIAPYAAISCVVSFLMTGHRSVFPTQILSVKKSASVDVEIGHDLNHIHASFRLRDKSLMGLLLKISEKLSRLIRKGRGNGKPGSPSG